MRIGHIELQPVYGWVRDADMELDGHLWNEMSVLTPGAWFSPLYRRKIWDGRARFYRRPGGRFLRGLLPKVLKILVEAGVKEPQIRDLREQPIGEPIAESLRGISFEGEWAFQLGQVEAMIQQQQGVLRSATGAGKTEVLALLIARLGVRTVLLTHTKELFFQTIERLERRLPVGTKIGRIGIGLYEPEFITVAMVQTLYSHLYRSKQLEVLQRCGCIIADEVHHGSANSWYKILEKTPAYYRFGVSAEPLTGKEPKDWRLLGLTGPVIEGISLKKLVEKDLAARPEIHMIPVLRYVVGRGYARARHLGIDENEELNVEVARRLIRHEDESVLVLVQTIRHGKYLQRICKRNGIDVEFVSGKDKTEWRRQLLAAVRAKRVSKVIATTVYDEGVDIPAIDVLVLAGGGKLHRKLLQRIGRAVRKRKGKSKAIIYDFMNRSNRYLKEHSLERLSLYQREGFEIISDEDGSLPLTRRN